MPTLLTRNHRSEARSQARGVGISELPLAGDNSAFVSAQRNLLGMKALAHSKPSAEAEKRTVAQEDRKSADKITGQTSNDESNSRRGLKAQGMRITE